MLRIFCIVTSIIVIHGFSYQCPKDCSCHGFNLDCSKLNLTNVPVALPNISRELKLVYNNIKNIARDSFRELVLLRRLYLGFNFLTIIKENDFVGLKNLRNLDISFNQLETIHENALRPMTNLKDVDLQGNKLTNIDGILSGLSMVDRIDLSKNQFTTINRDSFKGIKNLRHLVIRENKISEIDLKAFHDNPLLSSIMLTGNPIGNVDGLFEQNAILTFFELTNCSLKTFPKGLPQMTGFLYLDQNHLTSITRKEIENNKMLIKLHLSENAITTIEKEAFTVLNMLSELWLSFNSLTEIPLIPISTKLLYLDENNIEVISKENFPNGSRLETLSIQSNKISSIDNGTFEYLPNLTKLFLGGNDITNIPDLVFQPMPSLKELGLTGMDLNFIDEYAFNGLSDLEVLSLAFTAIDDIALQGNIFKPLKKLKFLDLQESPELAKKVINSNQMLQSLFTVEELNLKDNGLENLNSAIMKYMPRLFNLKLEGNKFHCDRSILWLWKWIEMEAYKFENADELQCDSPPELQGNPIIGMRVKQFVPTTLKPLILSTKGQHLHTTKAPIIIFNSTHLENGSLERQNNTNSEAEAKATETTMIYVPNKIDRAKLPNLGKDGDYEGKINNILIITVVATIAVVLFAVIVTTISCLKCERKKEASFNRTDTFPDNDVTFYVISDEAPPLPPPNPGRRDRVSVSSTRDITDEKVFTIDNDS